MNKPNILVFMTDQQRGDSVTSNSIAKTPNIDKFCKKSTNFTNTHTIAPHCCPSRASFFTGLYPTEHGVWNNVSVASAFSKQPFDGVKMWSQDLRDNGYHMMFSGKWHVSSVDGPDAYGFEHVYLPNEVINGTARYTRPTLEREMKAYENSPCTGPSDAREFGDLARTGYPNNVFFGAKDNPFNDERVMLDSVLKIKAAKDEDKPWCLFTGTLGPHDPYTVPQQFLDMYSMDDIELPKTFNDAMEQCPELYRKTRERFDVWTEEEHKAAILHYHAFCTYEDYLFGELLDAVEESGQADNTIIIYTSDHGDYLASHGLWTKGLPCYKEAYHVPLIIHDPRVEWPRPNVVDKMVSLVDVAPTILDLAGVKTDSEFSGQSLSEFIAGGFPSDWRTEFYYQSIGNEQLGIQRTVVTDRWKLVYNGFGSDQLYDLHLDPDEVENLIDIERVAYIKKELYKLLWQFAIDKQDPWINPYPPVALAEFGPGIALNK